MNKYFISVQGINFSKTLSVLTATLFFIISKLESSDLGEISRIGNTLWCSYGKYKPMATHAESICCLEKHEIHESYFKGILSFVFEIFLSSNVLVRRQKRLN